MVVMKNQLQFIQKKKLIVHDTLTDIISWVYNQKS